MEYTSSQEEQLTHRDLRSCQKALHRQRKQSQKYYGYRGVKPSWVGQKYYTFVLVPNKDSKTLPNIKSTSTTRVSRNIDVCDLQSKRFQPRDAHVSDENTPIKLYDKFGDWAWKTLYHDNYAALCVAEARAKGTLTHAPAALSSLECALRNLDYFPDTASAIPASQKVVLTLETWTKQDNFAQKDIGIYPLCSRHHRGKKYREKGCRKENVKKLRRGAKSLNVERTERDEIAQTRGMWMWEEEQPLICCEHCMIDLDVDSFMEGEFQDPEEYQKAWDVLWSEMKEERVAEGDPVWMMFYGKDRAKEGESKIKTEVDVVEENGQDSDACQIGNLTPAHTEHESDPWSEIVFISGSLTECDAGSHPDSGFDTMSDADLSIDVEWEVLSSMDEIIWETPG